MSRETVHSPVLARHFFVNLPPWIFQPSCCGRSLLTGRTEKTMANKNNKRKRKRVRREYNCTSHLIRITSRSLSNFTSPGMVDNFSSGVTVNQISIAKTNITHTHKNAILHPLFTGTFYCKDDECNVVRHKILCGVSLVWIIFLHHSVNATEGPNAFFN